MKHLNSQTQGFIITCLLYIVGFIALSLNIESMYALLSRHTSYEVTSIALSSFSDKMVVDSSLKQQQKTKSKTSKAKPTQNTRIAKNDTQETSIKDIQQMQDSADSTPTQANISGANVDVYALKIYQLIDEAYFYPSILRERGINGEVRMQFCIDSLGNVKDITPLYSNEKRLEDVAMRIIKIASKKFPKPDNERTMVVTLGFGTKKYLR